MNNFFENNKLKFLLFNPLENKKNPFIYNLLESSSSLSGGSNNQLTFNNIKLKFNYDGPLVPIVCIINNKINDYYTGHLWLVTKEYNWLGQEINITIESQDFKCIVDQLTIYNESILPEYKSLKPNNPYRTYHLILKSPFCSLEKNITSRCFNSFSPQDVINYLVSNEYKENYDINIDKNKKPWHIQYNENNYEFFKRIIGENHGLFFWNNKLYIGDQLNNNKNIDPTNIIYKKINCQYQPEFIKEKSYLYKKYNPNNPLLMEEKKGNKNNFQQLQGTYEIYGNKKLNLNTNYYFTKNYDIHIGYTIEEEIVIENKYIFLLNYCLDPIIDDFLRYHIEPYGYYNPPSINNNPQVNILITTDKNNDLSCHYNKPNLGFQTAFVKSINETYSNEYGDIFIEFPWDVPVGNPNITNGAWVRYCNNLSGNEYGTWNIPKPGQEVVVNFLNNDIYQPFIAGTLYNNFQKPFAVEPDKIYIKTKNQEIIIDEKNQSITVNNKKDINCNIEGSYNFLMNGTEGSYNVTIKNGPVNINLENGSYNTTIKGDYNLKIDGNYNLDVTKDINIHSNNCHINSDQQLNIKNIDYNINNTNYSLTTTNYTNNNTNSTINSTQWNLNGDMVKVESKDFSINTLNYRLNSKVFDMDIEGMGSIKSTIFSIEGTMVKVSSDGLMTLSSTGLVNVKSGFFCLTSMSSVIIRGSIPGSIGCFPPYYP